MGDDDRHQVPPVPQPDASEEMPGVVRIDADPDELPDLSEVDLDALFAEIEEAESKVEAVARRVRAHRDESPPAPGPKPPMHTEETPREPPASGLPDPRSLARSLRAPGAAARQPAPPPASPGRVGAALRETRRTGTQAPADEVAKEVQAELAAARERLERFRSDFENFKRRAARDRAELEQTAHEGLIRALIPVLDDFEHGFATPVQSGADCAVGEVVQGFRMAFERLLRVLAEFGVEQFDPQGEPFDPSLHEAIGLADNADVPPGTVVAVHRKGYTLRGRVIRHAVVTVTRPSASSSVPDSP